MATPFNIVAQLQLQAPTNLQAVVGQIKSALTGISATVNLNINANVAQVLQQLNAQLVALQTNLQNTQTQANAAGQAVANVGTNAAQAGQQVAQANTQLASMIPSLKAINAATQQAGNAMENFGMQAGLAARRYTAFLIAGGAIVGFINSLRQGFEEALKFDREMVRLGQIGGTTAEEIGGLSTEISRLATTWGASAREMAQASLQLRQAGLSATDTKVALEALAKSSLSPSFGSMADTTEGLIAAMNQFKLSASDAENTLSAINAVSTRYAVSSQDLIDSIRRTGGAFHAAGGNLNELIALFGAVRSTSRESAESIGSSLRTIFVRMQRAPVVENLRHLGIELRTTREEAAKMGSVNLENQFVGPYEALRRLSTALQNIRSTDPRYSAITEELGGYRQISKIIPLMQEFGKAQDIYNTAQQSGNSITKSAEQAQTAFLVKIAKVREEFQALIRTITESRGFHVFLDMIIQLTSGLTKLASVLTPLIPLFTVLATFKIAQGMGSMATGFMKGLSGQSPRFAIGGVVPGVGDGDTVPAMLTPGEFIIRKQAAQSIGYGTLAKMNKYAEGGMTRAQKKKAYVFDLDDTLVATSPEDEEQISALKAQGKHGAAFMMGYADPQVLRRSRRGNLLGFAQRAKGDRYIMTARSGTPELNEAIAELGPWNGIITVGSMDLKVPGKRAGTMRKATTAEKKQYALRDLLGRGYDQVVFMDDNEENIAAAAAVEGVKALTARTSRTGFAEGGPVPLKPGHRLGQVSLVQSEKAAGKNEVPLSRARDMTQRYLETTPTNFQQKLKKEASARQEFFGNLDKYIATAPIDTHIMQANGAISNILGAGIETMDARLAEISAGVGGGRIKVGSRLADDAGFKRSAEGYIFESFLSSFGTIAAKGEQAPLDFPSLSQEDRSFINHLFTPTPIKANDVDAKRTSKPQRDIIIKGMNADLFYTKPAFDTVVNEFQQKWFTPKKKKKKVGAQTSAEAAETVALPEAAQKAAMGGIIQRFAEGGSPKRLPEDIETHTWDYTDEEKYGPNPYLRLTAEDMDRIRKANSIEDFKKMAAYKAMPAMEGIPKSASNIHRGMTKRAPAETGTDILQAPTGGDSLFIMTYGTPGEIGHKIGKLPVTKIEKGIIAEDLRQKNIRMVTGPVTVYGISQHAKDEFTTEFEQPINQAMQGVFRQRFAGRAGKDADFTLSKQQIHGIMGHVFEKYMTGLFNVASPGGNQHFDYTNGFNKDSGPGLNRLIYPTGPVKEKLGDAKLNYRVEDVDDIFRKWLNYRQGQQGYYAKGGEVDTVPALLTPGEFIINKQSAQRIGYSALEQMNRSGIAKFATGGPVRMAKGGKPEPETQAVTYAEAPDVARRAGATAEAIDRMIQLFDSLGMSVQKVERVLIRVADGEIKVLGQAPRRAVPDTIPLSTKEPVFAKTSALPATPTPASRFVPPTAYDATFKSTADGGYNVPISKLPEFAEALGMSAQQISAFTKEVMALYGSIGNLKQAIDRDAHVYVHPTEAAEKRGSPFGVQEGLAPEDYRPPSHTPESATFQMVENLQQEPEVIAEPVYGKKDVHRLAKQNWKPEKPGTGPQPIVGPPDIFGFERDWRVPGDFVEPESVKPNLTPVQATQADVRKARATYQAGVSGAITEAGGVYGQHVGGQLSAEGADALKAKQLNALAAQLLTAKEKELKEVAGINSALERRQIAEKQVAQILTGVLAQEQQELAAETQTVMSTKQKAAAQTQAAAAAEAAAANAVTSAGGKAGAKAKDEPMMRGMGAMLFGMGTQYLASYADKAAGTAEEAAGGGNTAGYTASKTIGGAAQMAGMGATIGLSIAPLLGPFAALGPILGGVGGAAIGAMQSFMGCSKELEEAKLKIQQADMGKALDEALKKRAGTKDTTVQTQLGVTESWERERQQKIEESRSGIRASLRSGTEQAGVEKGINAEFDKRMEGERPKFAQLYAQDMRTFTRQQLVNNPQMSQAQIEEAFDRQNSQRMNTVFKGDYGKYRTEIMAGGREERRQADLERSQGNIGILVRDFESMGVALRTATSGLNDLARATAVSEDLYKGSVSAMQVRNPTENMGEIGGPNPANFMRGLQDVATPFGERGQQLLGTGQAVDAVRRELIATLPTLAKEGRNTGGEDLGNAWMDRVSASLDAKGVQGQQRDSIMESVRAQLNAPGQDFQKLGQNLQNDASSVVNNLMRNVQEPLQKNAEEMGRQLQQAGQTFSNASARFQQQLMELGQMADQTAKVEQEALQIRRQGEAALTHTGGMAAFNVPLEEQQFAFRARQQRLAGDAGIVGEAAFDPNALSTRRRGVQGEARNLQQRIDKGEFGAGALGPQADAWKRATDKLHDLERVAAELGQAQENLTHINETSAGVQERLNVLAKEEESRRGLAEKWLTGDSRARSDMMRGNQLMHVAMNRGTLEGFTPKDTQLIIQYMRQSGGVREGNRTREDWLQALLSNVRMPYDKAAASTTQEREQLQNQRNAAANRAVQASGNIREDAARQAGQQRDTANTAIAEIGPQLNANLKSLDVNVQLLTDAMKEFRQRAFGPAPAPTPAPAHAAAGGSIFRPYGTDTVPAMLTPGEYVVNRESAQANRKLLERINKSRNSVYLARGDIVPDDPFTLTGELEAVIKQRAEGREDATPIRTPTGVLRPRIVEPTGIMPGPLNGRMRESDIEFLARTTRPTVMVNGKSPAEAEAEDDNWGGLANRVRKHRVLNPLAGISKDVTGLTPEELRAGSVTIAGRDNRSMTGLINAGSATWDKTHDRGLQAQAIIGAAGSANIRDFSRASAAATVAAGLGKVHIGQVAPGMTDQLQWGESAKQRMALTTENLARAGQKIETDMATDAFKKQFGRAPTDADELKKKFDFTGFFARQQMRMGAGADNMAQPVTSTHWVTDENGVTVGRLVPGSNGFVITSPEVMNRIANVLQTGDKRFNKVDLQNLARNNQGTWLNAHPKWKISRLADGGVVPGDGQSDTTPALLTAGEFVVSAHAARAIGYGTLQRFNQPGYYQGGGPVRDLEGRPMMPSPANQPPIDNNFGQNIDRLQNAFSIFGASVSNLVNAISKLPPSIALTGNHNVNVNINGGEVFNELKGTIANMIAQHVTAAINNFVGQRFGGEVPKITAAEAPKALDVPMEM